MQPSPEYTQAKKQVFAHVRKVHDRNKRLAGSDQLVFPSLRQTLDRILALRQGELPSFVDTKALQQAVREAYQRRLPPSVSFVQSPGMAGGLDMPAMICVDSQSRKKEDAAARKKLQDQLGLPESAGSKEILNAIDRIARLGGPAVPFPSDVILK